VLAHWRKHVILIPSQAVFPFTPECHMHTTDFLVFDFGLNPQSTTLWVSKLTITPLMWLWRNFQLLFRETNSGLKFEIFIQIISFFFSVKIFRLFISFACPFLSK
jgi:hypothetical protein